MPEREERPIPLAVDTPERPDRFLVGLRNGIILSALFWIVLIGLLIWLLS